MGKGGGGTNTVVQNSSPPANVMAAYDTVMNQAQGVASQPLQQYQGPLVAGFTPDQQTAMGTINNSQGIASPYLNQAQQYIQNSAAPITPQSFNPQAIAQYENPYQNDVINSSLALMNQQDAQQQQGLVGNAISSGAWGGDRASVAQGILGGQQALARNSTIAGLNSQNYQQALAEFNNQQQTGLNAAATNASLNAQAGYGEANLGTTAQNSALTGASAQLQSGALQQQLAQENLNVPYENYLQAQSYPYQSTQFLANIAEGIGGASGGSSSTTSPSPSGISQVAGLGLSGLSLYGLSGGLKRGGSVRGYAPGGLIPDPSQGFIPANAPMGHTMGPPPAPAAPAGGGQQSQGDPGAALGIARMAKHLNTPSAAGAFGDMSFGPDAMVASAYPEMAMNPATTAGGMFSLANGADISAASALPALDTSGLGTLASEAVIPDLTSSLAAAGTDAAISSTALDAAAGSSIWETIAAAFLALNKGGRVPYKKGGIVGYDDGGGVLDQNAAINDIFTRPEEELDNLPQQTIPDLPPISAATNGLGATQAGPVAWRQPSGGISGSKDDFATSPWTALLAAGLGMAGGTSPFAATNIANGGLQGLSYYNQAKKLKAEEDYREGMVDYRQQSAQTAAQKLAEEAKYHEGMLAKGKYQLLPGNGPDDKGEQVPGVYKFNANTGDYDFQPGVKLTGKPGGNSGGVTQWKYQAWLNVHPGDDKGALEYAGGHKTMTPEEINKSAINMAQKDIAFLKAKTDDDKKAIVDSYANLIHGAQVAPSAAPAAASATTTKTNPVKLGTAENPIIPKTQKDIDDALPGTVFGVPDPKTGQISLHVKRKPIASPVTGQPVEAPAYTD